MKILAKFQPTEEKLHQSTTSNQENLDKELILYQLVQAQSLLLRRRLPSLNFNGFETMAMPSEKAKLNLIVDLTLLKICDICI